MVVGCVVSRRVALTVPGEPNMALQATGDSAVFFGCAGAFLLSPAPELRR